MSLPILSDQEISEMNRTCPALSRDIQVQRGKYPVRGLGDLLQQIINGLNSIPPGSTDEKVKIDVSDPTAGYLQAKFNALTSILGMKNFVDGISVQAGSGNPNLKYTFINNNGSLEIHRIDTSIPADVVVWSNVDPNGAIKLRFGASVNEFDIDGTLSANVDWKVPTVRAVKTYVDAHSGGGGLPEYHYFENLAGGAINGGSPTYLLNTTVDITTAGDYEIIARVDVAPSSTSPLQGLTYNIIVNGAHIEKKPDCITPGGSAHQGFPCTVFFKATLMAGVGQTLQWLLYYSAGPTPGNYNNAILSMRRVS